MKSELIQRQEKLSNMAEVQPLQQVDGQQIAENITTSHENHTEEPIVVVVNAPNSSNSDSHLAQSQTAKKPAVILDSDESSEDGFLELLEEGRAPLLGGGVNAANDYEPVFRYSDYSTTRGDSANEDVESENIIKQVYHRLPEERWKAGIAFLLLFVAALSNDIVLSFIHDNLPDTAPLPDFVFENTPYWPWALNISEYLMLTLFTTLIIVIIFHRHRWILLRRLATIGSILYFGRCVTMFVTQVPVADTNYYCSPKFLPEERTFWNIFLRGLRVLTGLGLKINGKHTLCGDYIYSGHTIVHVTCYLFIKEYTPKKWYILHYATLIFAMIGVLCLLVSRGHYTIDVIIAYWIGTRTFWEYHTLANIPLLRNNQQGRNHIIKSIWFPLFKFMESNALKPVPKRYGLPFRLFYNSA